MGKTFGHASKVLPKPGLRGAELLAIDDKVCPGLAQDGHNVESHAKSFALVWPWMGKTFGRIPKVLPWPGPKWAELSAIHQSSTLAWPKMDKTSSYTQQFLLLLAKYEKFCPGRAQDGQNFW